MHDIREKIAVVYPQTSQISSIALHGYYHNVIEQQVNISNDPKSDCTYPIINTAYKGHTKQKICEGYWGEPEGAPHRRYNWEISYNWGKPERAPHL